MKKQSRKTAKMMQQGGLMIEALAMLGLISVVTPTMYKKAAERTMEVEDINTASTVRTYANAAESYVANNYGKLMDTQFTVESTVTDPNTGETKTVKTPKADGTTVNLSADDADFKKYLPYGFEPSRSLYDYNTPKIRIVKNGTNLTSFVLFPAKSGADIGQERTARIASLIGSSGGYMTNDTTARGVGGIWQLSVGENGVFKAADFGANDSKQYSLVTMSSNAMTDNNGGMIDNDKYLQRTYEGSGQEWRNTMHADLYMGNHMSGETQSIAADLRQRNSIRDVKSLIIGADVAATVTDGETTSESKNNGLYIAGTDGSDYADAYIGGALRAAGEEFVVRNAGTFNGEATARPQLVFGKSATDGNYNFVVNENGDIYDAGYNGELFNRFKSFTGDSNENSFNIGGGAVQATYTKGTDTHHKLSMHLGDDDTFKIATNAGEERDDMAISMLGPTMKIYNDSTADKKQRISMFKVVDNNGIMTDNATGEPGMTVNGQAGKDSLGNDIGPKYNSTTTPPDFRVDVGANVKVQGVLAAGQVDTQHLRTASFSSGSENIDDELKWMTVDKDGVRIIEPDANQQDGVAAIFEHENILLSSDYAEYNGDRTLGGALLRMTGTYEASNAEIDLDAENAHITLSEGDAEIRMQGGMSSLDSNDPDDYEHDFRVRQSGGNFDLDAANLNLTDEEGNLVFSVRGNDSANDGIDRFDDDYTRGSSVDYNVAMHGNVMFTSNDGEQISGADRGEVKYLSIGQYDKEAGVNIIATGKTGNDYIKNVLVIDQTEDEDSTQRLNKLSGDDVAFVDEDGDEIDSDKRVSPGTVYIRRGAIEVAPNDDISNSYLAHEGLGVIRASRFVANNSNKIRHTIRVPNHQATFYYTYAYEVPDQLTNDEYRTYNGGNKTASNTYRYDTYMVNPAYTSVMNDIKLTTRGGARLSDILPDFINKGIYVANNTYDEGMDIQHFGGWRNAENPYGSSSSTVKFASPYLGSIPAPQCPPGYGKVIAVHPISFNMAQAGRLTKDGTRYIANQEANIPYKKVNEQGVEYSASSLNYAKLKVNYNNGNASNKTITLEESVNGTTADVSHTVKNVSSDLFTVNKENSTLDTYVLTSDNPNTAEPITFQQSTYLKTKVEPLVETNGYTSGWAALMGFIYPGKIYEDIIKGLSNYGNRYAASNSSNNANIDVSNTDNNWYWNIFPVLKNSLEAYATVYCYFDRTNMGTRYSSTSNIDPYDYLSNNPKQFVPTNTTYREKLNDPTLKYNELW